MIISGCKDTKIFVNDRYPPLNSVKGEELISGGKNFVGGFGIINIKIYPTIEKICYLCSPFVLFVGAWG